MGGWQVFARDWLPPDPPREPGPVIAVFGGSDTTEAALVLSATANLILGAIWTPPPGLLGRSRRAVELLYDTDRDLVALRPCAVGTGPTVFPVQPTDPDTTPATFPVKVPCAAFLAEWKIPARALTEAASAFTEAGGLLVFDPLEGNWRG